jgi:hypothetical protein
MCAGVVCDAHALNVLNHRWRDSVIEMPRFTQGEQQGILTEGTPASDRGATPAQWFVLRNGRR